MQASCFQSHMHIALNLHLTSQMYDSEQHLLNLLGCSKGSAWLTSTTADIAAKTLHTAIAPCHLRKTGAPVAARQAAGSGKTNFLLHSWYSTAARTRKAGFCFELQSFCRILPIERCQL